MGNLSCPGLKNILFLSVLLAGLWPHQFRLSQPYRIIMVKNNDVRKKQVRKSIKLTGLRWINVRLLNWFPVLRLLY